MARISMLALRTRSAGAESTRADPRVWRSDQSDEAIGHIAGGRAMLLCPIAFAATAIWSAILYFGSRAAGFQIEAGWLVAELTMILLLHLLGLSMAATASAHRTTTGMGSPKWADLQPRRRKLGRTVSPHR